jgi:hypothetical protein
MPKRFRPTMLIRIHAIGGEFVPGPGGDTYIGTAHDPTTALTLLDYVELKKGYAVSLHGDGLIGMHAFSGVETLARARDLFRLQHHRTEVANEMAKRKIRA